MAEIFFASLDISEFVMGLEEGHSQTGCLSALTDENAIITEKTKMSKKCLKTKYLPLIATEKGDYYSEPNLSSNYNVLVILKPLRPQELL